MKLTRTTPALTLLTLSLGGIAACGDANESTAEPTSTTASTTMATSSSTVPADSAPTTTTSTVPDEELAPPTVELIDAGAEPREIRRLAYAPGTYRMQMAQTQHISQTIDGQEASVGPITTVFGMEIGVSTGPEGFFVTTTITDVAAGDDTDPAIASNLEQSLSAIIGFTSTSLIDDRGLLVRRSELKLPATLPPELTTLLQGMSLDQLANPLPAESIGVGARWSVTQEFDAAGIHVTQTLIHELTGVDGQRLLLASSGTASAALGPIEMPNVPDDVEVELTSFDTIVTSDADFDLTKPLQTSSATSESNQSMTISGDGQTGTFDQYLTMTMTVMPDAG